MATDMLVPALRDVREAQAALANRFKAHLAVTPAGEYREVLERRAGDARGHMHRIDERLGTLQPRRPVLTVLGVSGTSPNKLPGCPSTRQGLSRAPCRGARGPRRSSNY
ncbi:hypothetical protein [Streptomyces sp. NPDC001816]|uniref:hypothetical protein n=1 Tax=Streptomyces sp. NPDC001816 TaxID=3364612 RepID=UPI00367BF8D3